MKKYLFLIMASVVLMMTGCKKDNNNGNNGNDNGGDTPGVDPQTELQDPIIVSKSVVRLATGFNTMFVKVHNPNDVAVDYEYDVDFMRNGVVLSNAEGIYCYSLGAGSDMMNWYNFNIPDNVDEIVIKNMKCNKTYYEHVKLNLVKEQILEDRRLLLEFTAEKEFTDAYVNVVFYYDNQIVAYEYRSFFNGDPIECVMDPLVNYNRYEVYAKAYNIPVNQYK